MRQSHSIASQRRGSTCPHSGHLTMHRQLVLGSLACVLIVTSVLFLLLLPDARVFAASLAPSSPTPDATAVLNAASDAVSHAQDVLNLVNIFAGILGLVLAFFGFVAAALAFLGFRSYQEVTSLAKEFRTNIAQVRIEADKTREALVYVGLGDRLLSQKDKMEEALENYKKAGKLLPNDAPLQYDLGRIYSGVGDYDAAITAFEASHPPDTVNQARVQKELGLAYRRRGTAFNQEADYDMAAQCLKKSIGLNPDDSDALAILGGLYRRKGEYLQAFASYERAWRANPASSYALGNLASLSWYLGKQREADMYFRYLEVAVTGRMQSGQAEIYWDYYDLALAQLALGKVDEAKQMYATAIRETPGKVQFEGVLSNLRLLQQAPQPMSGLDDVVRMIQDAEDRRV